MTRNLSILHLYVVRITGHSFTVSMAGLRCRSGLFVSTMKMVSIISAALPTTLERVVFAPASRVNDLFMHFSPLSGTDGLQAHCERARTSFDARLHLHPWPMRCVPHQSES